MRLFIALELPQEVREWLADASREVRDELPKARWVRPELMHLTLVFLGEVDEGAVPALDRETAAAVAPYPPLELAVRGFGAFPPRGRARVLWAGLATEGDLAGLQETVAAAVERAVGVAEDRKKGRGFSAHVTLARCQPTWPRWAVDKLEQTFASRPAPAAFHIDHVRLISSRVGRGQGRSPEYQTVSAYPLEGSP